MCGGGYSDQVKYINVIKNVKVSECMEDKSNSATCIDTSSIQDFDDVEFVIHEANCMYCYENSRGCFSLPDGMMYDRENK